MKQMGGGGRAENLEMENSAYTESLTKHTSRGRTSRPPYLWFCFRVLNMNRSFFFPIYIQLINQTY